MRDWEALKDAFWAAVDGDADQRARHSARLASIDPALPGRLDALLAADDRQDALLDHLFDTVSGADDPPDRIGTYDVLGVLGAGGMGEVYRARDVRLHRDVAIKVLPAALTNDPDRLARFEREAQVLASLNHRHVAHVYGLEESHGAPALVMELVSGPTLASVIADHPGGSLPLPRALGMARQIAEGLDAAHERGIIHRDLKPTNVALTAEGDVKILDFGVAKSVTPGAPTSPAAAVATDVGLVLGTPAYMSPEQARGLPVDKRTDIWAFGCLLYELLTGRQAFGGPTASDSLAAVLDRDPDMTLLPAETPRAVRSLLRHCLEKDPRRRLRDIADARLALDDALSQPSDERTPGDRDIAPRRLDRHLRARWLLAGAGMAAVATVLLLAGRSPSDARRRLVASVVLPPAMRLTGADLEAQASESRFAVSPDGRRLALIAADESGLVQLWLRDLASGTFQPLPDTVGASYPFWSPDSAAIGFLAAGRLRTIRLSDGAVMTVADAAFRIGAWSRDNLILFAPARSSPLHVVPATGGTPRAVTTLDQASGEVQHGFPSFLPDGRRFLYFSIGTLSGGAIDPRGIYLGSLDGSGPARLLLPGATQARYADGHILFVQNGTLMAQPFAPDRGVLLGSPVPLIEDARLTTTGATGPTTGFSVSETGLLVYQAAVRAASRLAWFDRSGAQLAAAGEPADYAEVALSPDGGRLVSSVLDPSRGTRDLWLYEAEGGRGRRLTFDPGDEFAPVWSPDGARLVFSSATKGLVGLQMLPVDTPGGPSPLEVDALGLGRYASDWSRDGHHLLYIGGGRVIARSDLWLAPLASPRDARALLESTFVETHGRFAPGGGWLAYASNETGRLEVYVDRFPALGAKRLVSTAGGRWPRWSRDGTELFYVSAGQELMAVRIQTTADRIDLGVPRALFVIRPRAPVRLDAYPYDVTPDGRRFVVNALVEDTTATAISLVVNWAEGLANR